MKKTLIIAFFLIFIVFNIYAEEASKGRLPDGRAYRVDDQGYQLVDYIAELEMRVEELESQLVAARNEKTYPSETTDFAEKDLITQKVIAPQEEIDVHLALANEQEACPELECPSSNCPSPQCPECSCEEATGSCYTMLKHEKQTTDSLIQEVALLKSNLELYKTQASEAKNENEKLKAYEVRLDDLNRELLNQQKTASARSKEIETLKLQMTSQEAEAGDVTNILSKQKAEIASLQAKIISQEDTISKLDQEKARYALNLEQSRAALNEQMLISKKQREIQEKQKVEQEKILVRQTKAPVLSVKSSPKRDSAFEHLKNKLRADLKELEGLIKERNQLERKYDQSPKKQAVKIQLSNLKSQDGFTVSVMKSEIEKAKKFYSLGRLQKNIFGLKKAVKKDIAVLERLI